MQIPCSIRPINQSCLIITSFYHKVWGIRHPSVNPCHSQPFFLADRPINHWPIGGGQPKGPMHFPLGFASLGRKSPSVPCLNPLHTDKKSDESRLILLSAAQLSKSPFSSILGQDLEAKPPAVPPQTQESIPSRKSIFLVPPGVLRTFTAWNVEWVPLPFPFWWVIPRPFLISAPSENKPLACQCRGH